MRVERKKVKGIQSLKVAVQPGKGLGVVRSRRRERGRW